MKNIDLSKIKKTHFVGIGGIGVSAIARMMLAEGKIVGGSDTSDSAIIDELRKIGAKIFIGHSADNIAYDIDLIIHTPAAIADNPELKKAAKLNIPILSYPEILGLISKNKYIIAVSGTHGKTTTTAMIAKIAVDGGLNPTVIIGSLFKNSGSNLILPKSNYKAGNKNIFIVEACEYKRSFLNLEPNILIITNIEEDHLDYYKNLSDIQSAFTELASKLGPDDFLVCNPNDKNLASVVKSAKCKVIDYSLVSLGLLRNSFSKLTIPKLKVFGRHNIENAKAAFAVSEILKIKKEKILKSLSEFEAVWRRFEYKGKMKNRAKIYDDYAHHPTEIRAALSAARLKFPDQKIITVFQPHLYSRTKLLFNDFVKSFTDADKIIITPIYAAREEEDKSINSRILADEINKNGNKDGIKAKFCQDFNEIEKYLRQNTKKDDIIITMGAGDIYKVGENLIEDECEYE